MAAGLEVDAQHLRSWIGRSETSVDQITSTPLARLAATLERDDLVVGPGCEVPPLWHWLYCTPRTRRRELGADGHARLGGFLPPVPLPLRMWAGGRLQFHRALQLGDEVTRESRIEDVTLKHGRSGPLAFVCVRHELRNAYGVAIVEEHDIVYRERRATTAPAALVPAPHDEAFAREIVPDAVLLFRYSALTFNGHRIHYDYRYARDVEGYPGLVVHGPLIATLLLDLVQRNLPDAVIRRFEFRATRPLFDIHPFSVCARPEGASGLVLWARDHEGWLAMQARAELA